MSFGCAPRPHSRTPIEAYSLQVEPADHFVKLAAGRIRKLPCPPGVPEPCPAALTITVGLIADMKVINPFDFFIEDWAEHIPFEYPQGARRRPQAISAPGRRG